MDQPIAQSGFVHSKSKQIRKQCHSRRHYMSGQANYLLRLRTAVSVRQAQVAAVLHRWTSLAVPRYVDAIFTRLQVIPLERYTAAAAAVLFNIFVVWIFVANVKVPATDSVVGELHATIFTEAQHPSISSEPHLQPAAIALVPVPDIVIEAAIPSTTAILADSMSQILPPRPDVRHINKPPALPQLLRSLGAGFTVILRIFVLSDGSITDAHVVRTSGDPRLDAFAIEYVKANWRYVPATISGTSTQDWTTVLVPFSG
jgi:TonB family protein